MKKVIIFFLLLNCSAYAFAQTTLMASQSEVTFISETPINKISAVNTTAEGKLDLKNNTVSIHIDMRNFQFKNRLMQEHFNADFVHSDTYPVAVFKGRLIRDNLQVTGGSIPEKISAEGILSFHGVIRDLTITGLLQHRQPDMVHLTASFPLMLADFGVEVPLILQPKIASTVSVNAAMNFYTRHPE